MNKFVYNGKTTIKTQLTKFIFAIAYLALAFVTLTFVDSQGRISNDGGLANILRGILASAGLNENLNIEEPTFRVLFIGVILLFVGIALFLALPLIFSATYKRFVAYNRLRKLLVDAIIAVVILAIIAIIFFGIVVGANDVEINDENLSESIKAFVLVGAFWIFAILIITIAAYIIIKLYSSVQRVVKTEILVKPEEDPNAKISIFPTLEESDKKLENYDADKVRSEAPSLEEISNKFQAYLATVHKIYFDIDLIRAFVAGMATSKIVLLEGLSGTGKSTLPRRFMEFIGGESEFISVQSTWKDRADLIGYYNDFTSNFKETRFLKVLYENNYKTDVMSTVVLDEVNLSRVEYYFADFISAMEYPVDMRYIELMQPISGRKMPAKLEDGKIHIPENMYFVGTANKDESTYTITERVYDRAIVINFEQKHFPIETEIVTEPISVSFNQFEQLVNEAKLNEAGVLTEEESLKFEEIYNFINDVFDVQIGDRVFAQLNTFTAVYTACGGNKFRALDVMLANKFIRKLNNIFDDSMSENLDRLAALIDDKFGKENFVESAKQIANIKKKLY